MYSRASEPLTSSASIEKARKSALDCILHDAHTYGSEVAAAAAGALCRVCPPGDEDVVPVLTNLAVQTDRPEILLALASLCNIGDAGVLEALNWQLQKGHYPIRRAALQAL